MLLRLTILNMPAQVIGPLSQMVAAVAWTYWLGPEALGAYAIIWAIQELAHFGILSWWTHFVQRYATTLHTDGESERFDHLEILVQIASAITQAIFAVAAVSLVLKDANDPALLAAIVCFTLTRNLSTHFAARARAQFETTAFTLLQVIGPALGLVFGFVAVTSISATPQALLWAYALAQLLGLLIGLPLMRFRLRRPAIDRALLKRAFAFGAPLLVASTLAWSVVHAIRFIVGHVEGEAAVGLMTVGWWLGLRLTAFAALIMTGASFSIAVERMRIDGVAGALEQFATNSALLLGVLLPCVAGATLLNEAIVTTIVAEPYRQMTTLILPLAVAAGAFTAFCDHAIDQVFVVSARPHRAIYTSAVEAIATIVLCWVGMEIGGVYGAVVGCAIGTGIAVVYGFALARMTTGYYLRWDDVFRICGATLIMAAALLLLPKTASWAHLVLEIAAGAALYGLVIAIVYPDLRRQIVGAIRTRIVRSSA